MGITFLKVKVANPADRKRSEVVECIVDSGAIFSIIPTPILRGVGIRSDRREEFTLADGSHVKRAMGDAIFEIDGHRGAAPVIFGAKGDAKVVGALTLEALGMMLDPMRRELRPLPMLLV